MKFKFIYTLFSLLLLAFVFMSNENGRADSQGVGNTGAPGDEMIGNISRTCVSCHGPGSQIQMTLGIEVLDGSGTPVDNYTPGQTYRVKVTNNVVSGNPFGYGFQIVSLEAPEGVNANDLQAFSNPASNVKLAVANNGRQYAEHNGQSDINTFEVDWTAPQAGTGTITFYSCGNAVNDNNMSSGDGAACNSLELQESSPSSTTDAENFVKIFLFPNPVQDEMKLQLISSVAATFQIDVYDMQGRLIMTDDIDFVAGENIYLYDVSRFSRGTYLVKFSNDDKIAVAKLLKH